MVTQADSSVKLDRVVGDLYAALNDYKSLGFVVWFCGTKAERILRVKLWNAIRVAQSFEVMLEFQYHNSLNDLRKEGGSDKAKHDRSSELSRQRQALEMAVNEVCWYAMAWAS